MSAELGPAMPLTRGAISSRAIAGLREHRGFVAVSILAVGVLLVETRPGWFFHDEWVFIRDRSFADPGTWLLPHTQHMVVVHAAVYTALVAVFGTSTYLPFLVALWLANIGFAAAIYVLIDRHVGRGPALVTAAVLLLLGNGYLNLFWAFQMGPVASVALAMWGLLSVRERPWLAATLMGLGVATAGFALFVVPAAVLHGWSRRALIAGVAATLVYVVWFVAIGHASMVAYGDSPTLVGWVGWLAGGVSASAAALTGLGLLGSVLLAGALVLLACVSDRRAAAVGLAALLTEYAILGFSRQGVNSASGAQYVYFGAAFLLPVFASAWPAVPRLGRPAVAALALTAFIANLMALSFWSIHWSGYMAASDPLCRLCGLPSPGG